MINLRLIPSRPSTNDHFTDGNLVFIFIYFPLSIAPTPISRVLHEVHNLVFESNVQIMYLQYSLLYVKMFKF